MHSCRADLLVKGDEAALERGLANAFQEVPNLCEFAKVSPGLYKGYFHSVKCKYEDRFVFRIVARSDQWLKVDVFARSGSFCCLGVFPRFCEYPFYWMQCYGDNGQNRYNLKLIKDSLKQQGLEARLIVRYSSASHNFPVEPNDVDDIAGWVTN